MKHVDLLPFVKQALPDAEVRNIEELVPQWKGIYVKLGATEYVVYVCDMEPIAVTSPFIVDSFTNGLAEFDGDCEVYATIYHAIAAIHDANK